MKHAPCKQIRKGDQAMRFTYVENADLVRGMDLDEIVSNATVDVLTADINNKSIHYLCTLTDINIPQAITFLLIVNAQQRRVTSIEKRTHVVSDPLEDIKAKVWLTLGNDFGDLCYGIRIKEERIHVIEFDVTIDASGEISYSHRGFDNPDEPGFDDPADELPEDEVED